MRTRLRSKATVLFVAFAALLLAVAGTTMALTADPSGNTAPAPTIQSDKADYAPGETVTLTGSNWQPGESVHINVNDDVGQTWSYDSNPDVTADANGNIQHQFQLPNSFVATYKVTATGAQSGTATTSFTDGNVKFDAAPTGTTAQFVETLYTGATNCSGAVKSGYPKTLNNSNGDNVGLGNSESLRIDAAAQSDQTPKKDFVAWSTTNGSLFTVIEGTNGRSICIPGNQNGSQNYLATYGFRPVANNDSRSVNEDGTLNVAAPGVLANDTDADNSGNTNAGLTVKDSNPNLAGVQPESQPNNGTLTLNANGSFTYTPNANFNGTDSFTYKATDSGLDSNTATVSITVNAVNDPPVANNDSYIVNEDNPLTVAAAGVLTNDTDVDNPNNGNAGLTVKDADSTTQGIQPVSAPSHGTLNLNADGSYTYTPANNYHGSDSFTYKATDGTAESNTATVTITVNSVNDKPTADAQEVTTDEDVAKEITLVGNDVDGDSLTYTIVSEPQHGTLSGTGATRTYTPAENYHGPDSFTFKVNDGTDDSNTATVSITVTPVNDKPTADAQSVTTDEDTAKPITLTGNDVDGDTLSYTIASGPSHGTLTGTGANLTYTPAADYNGPDSFSFKTNDGTVDSDAATVSITVNSVNDKPVVTNLQGGVDTANEGDLKTYTFTITDSDSSNFSFASGSPNCGGTGKGQVVNGTAQISGTSGTFQCKFLDGGATATQVSVSAQVTDGQASSDPATKNVAVSNVAPKIDSLSGPAQILTNQPVTFTGTHSDPAGLLDNPFTWQWSGGTSTDTDKNNSYVTKFSACGPQNVKATVTDKDTGTSTEATLSTPVQAYNGNFLPPLQVGKDNMVQKGQVVPVKISVAGCDGLNKTGLNPEIRLAKGDPTVGINEADYTVPGIVAAADTSGVMRPVSDGYIYNLRIPSDASVKANDIYAIRVSPFGVLSDQHMVIAIQIRK
jgi:VCBS repeat-containing protein